MQTGRHHFDLLVNHGDLLEKENAELIASRLPNYAELWSQLIGNDGNCQILPLPKASKEQTAQQRELGQLVYTALESFLCINRLREKYTAWSGLPKPLTEDAYLDVITDHFAIYSHVGRIRDVLNKAAVVVRPELFDAKKEKIKAWGNKFEGLYDERCVVIHYRKVPLSFIEDAEHFEFLFPKIANSDSEDSAQWSGKEPWENASALKMENICHIFGELFASSLNNLNVSLGVILGFAKEHFGNLRVSFPDQSRKTASSNDTSRYVELLGNSEPAAASGVQPYPSGQRS